MTVPLGSYSYPAIVKIIEDSHLVLINIGLDGDITHLTYIVKVSPGATVINQPTNLSVPDQLIIQAEDGSSQNYKIIVTQVKGWFLNVHSANFSVSRPMRAIYQKAVAYYKYDNNGCSIELNYIDSKIKGNDDQDYVRLFFNPIAIARDLKGTFTITPYTYSVATCTFGFSPYPGSTGTGHFELSPSRGTITITAHDRTNNLISGVFTDIHYNVGTYPNYGISGEFTNVVIK